jgi:MFS family permease
MNSFEKRILRFANAGHFFTHFYVLMFPVIIMPVCRDLGISVAAAVRISFPMFLLYGMLSFPWGWLSDSWGPKWALGSGVFLSGLGCVLAGFSATAGQLTLGLAVTGIGCAAYHPSGVALISKGIRERGRALGQNGAWGGAGIAMAPLGVGILSYIFGWRQALWMAGLLGTLTGLGILAAPITVGREQDSPGKKVPARGIANLLFAINCLVMVVSGLLYRAWTVTFPAFLEHRLSELSSAWREAVPVAMVKMAGVADFDTLVAALVVSMIYAVGVLGQVLGGWVADRYDLRRAYLGFFLAACPFLLLMAFADGWLLIFAAGGYALFILGIQPVENSLVAILTPARWRSISYAVKFTLVFGVGSVAVYLAAWVERTHGLDGVIWLLVGLLALATSIVFLLVLTSRNVKLDHK